MEVALLVLDIGMSLLDETINQIRLSMVQVTRDRNVSRVERMKDQLLLQFTDDAVSVGVEGPKTPAPPPYSQYYLELSGTHRRDL